jgi:hypothetical protein
MTDPTEHPFASLPGISVKGSYDLPTDTAIVKVQQQFRDGTKVAGILPISGELARDVGLSGAVQLIEGGLHRVFVPWEYPDHNPFPTLVPFPRIARLQNWWNSRRHGDDYDEDDTW